MFFTKEDFVKIQAWLNAHSVKDTEFPKATELTMDELLPIVQGGKNKTIPIKDVLNIGKPNGLVPLGESGIIPLEYLPQYVEKIEEYAYRAYFPGVGSSDIIYVDLSTSLVYRWSGSQYITISSSIVTGTTVGTAFDGREGNLLKKKLDCCYDFPGVNKTIVDNSGRTRNVNTIGYKLPIGTGQYSWSGEEYLTVPKKEMSNGRVLFCKEGVPYWDDLVVTKSMLPEITKDMLPEPDPVPSLTIYDEGLMPPPDDGIDEDPDQPSDYKFPLTVYDFHGRDNIIGWKSVKDFTPNQYHLGFMSWDQSSSVDWLKREYQDGVGKIRIQDYNTDCSDPKLRKWVDNNTIQDYHFLPKHTAEDQGGFLMVGVKNGVSYTRWVLKSALTVDTSNIGFMTPEIYRNHVYVKGCLGNCNNSLPSSQGTYILQRTFGGTSDTKWVRWAKYPDSNPAEIYAPLYKSEGWNNHPDETVSHQNVTDLFEIQKKITEVAEAASTGHDPTEKDYIIKVHRSTAGVITVTALDFDSFVQMVADRLNS